MEKLWATRRIGEIIDELDLKGQNEELLKELVALSTRHGILTPYSPFWRTRTCSSTKWQPTPGWRGGMPSRWSGPTA